MTREKKLYGIVYVSQECDVTYIFVHDMFRLQDGQRCTHTKHISLQQYNQIIAITLLPK